LTALTVNQHIDLWNSYAVFDTHPVGESLNSLSLPLKRHGGVATFAKEYGPRCKPRLALTLEEQR